MVGGTASSGGRRRIGPRHAQRGISRIHAAQPVDDDRYASLTYRDQVVLASGPKTLADPIQLFPAATISGRVTNGSTGAPAAGIVVDAETNESIPASATTGSDGTYTLKQLRPGQYIVAIHPDPNLEKSLTAKAVENIAIPAGAAKTGIDLSLIPGVMLNGSVVAADDEYIAGFRAGVDSVARHHDGIGEARERHLGIDELAGHQAQIAIV